MSIKNIVTGQVASVTAYNAEGEVSGLSSANLAVDTITAGDIEANNILSVTSLTTNADLSVLGNADVSGNVLAGFFIGNGSQLTGMYGDTNVATYLSSGSQTGNIAVGGIKTDGYYYANGAVFGSSYSNANVAAYLPTYTGNIGNVGNVVSNMFVGNLRKADGNAFIVPLKNEWWIDPVNGDDTTGTGTIVSPYKTIAKALAASAPDGSVYNLAAGAYTEAVTWTKPNINVVGPGTGQLADLQGDQTIAHVAPGAIRFDNVGMQNVVISSSNAATYFYDTHIQGTITKSGNGYVAFDGNDVATGPINITGAGVVQFRNSIVDNITVNNASAAASLLSCTTELANYTVTSGVLGITGSTIIGSVGANLVTTAAGGTFVATGTLFSEVDFTPGKLALGGFWSMNAVSFDSANSTITGTNFGAPSYSDAVVTFGSVTALGTIKPRTATVTALGSAATAGVGARATVTNATLATFGSIAVNGGANVVPVYSNGTNWIIG